MSLSDYVNDDKDDADDHLHFNPNTKSVCLLQYSNWFQSGKKTKVSRKKQILDPEA